MTLSFCPVKKKMMDGTHLKAVLNKLGRGTVTKGVLEDRNALALFAVASEQRPRACLALCGDHLHAISGSPNAHCKWVVRGWTARSSGFFEI